MESGGTILCHIKRSIYLYRVNKRVQCRVREGNT